MDYINLWVHRILIIFNVLWQKAANTCTSDSNEYKDIWQRVWKLMNWFIQREKKRSTTIIRNKASSKLCLKEPGLHEVLQFSMPSSKYNNRIPPCKLLFVASKYSVLCFCSLLLLTRHQLNSTLLCNYQKPVLTNQNVSLFTLKWCGKQKSAFPAELFLESFGKKKKKDQKNAYNKWNYISDSHGE